MTAISQLGPQTSFESVIEATQQLLQQIEQEGADPAQITADIIHLLSLDKGPRGFFATFLTDARTLADAPPAAVLNALNSLPDDTAKRMVQNLVHNLAMSTAMIVVHQRNGDLENRAGSKQVQQRSQVLIRQLHLAGLDEALMALKQSTSNPGPYREFLDRWNYDSEQRLAIADVVTATLKDQ